MLTAHPVSQERLGVTRLHLHLLVVEHPIIVGFVEVGVGWREMAGQEILISLHHQDTLGMLTCLYPGHVLACTNKKIYN